MYWQCRFLLYGNRFIDVLPGNLVQGSPDEKYNKLTSGDILFGQNITPIM